MAQPITALVSVADMTVSFYGGVGFLSKMIAMNCMQQRCYSRAYVEIAKKALKYRAKYSKKSAGPKEVQVNTPTLLIMLF